MAGRSPARFLAPLALAAFVVALFVVVTSSMSPNDEAEPNQATETQPAASPEEGGDDGRDGERRRERQPRRYTIQPGDTPSGIAEETGVPLEEILRLNPELDPQALTPGTRIRLREREQ